MERIGELALLGELAHNVKVVRERAISVELWVQTVTEVGHLKTR